MLPPPPPPPPPPPSGGGGGGDGRGVGAVGGVGGVQGSVAVPPWELPPEGMNAAWGAVGGAAEALARGTMGGFPDGADGAADGEEMAGMTDKPRRGHHRRSVSDSVFSFAPALMNWDGGDGVSPPGLDGPVDADVDDPAVEDELFSLFINSEAFESAVKNEHDTSPSTVSQHDMPSAGLDASFGVAPASQALGGDGIPHVSSEGNFEQLVANAKLEVAGNDATGLDQKRAKRILANRQSAQRSRMRKLQYISDLEASVKRLQEQVSALTPHVQQLRDRKTALDAQNGELRAHISQLVCDNAQRDHLNDALRDEVNRLQSMQLAGR